MMGRAMAVLAALSMAAVGVAGAIARPAPVQAGATISVTQDSDALSYGYTIPAEAGAIAPLRQWMVADAEARKAKALAGYKEWAAGFDAGQKPPAPYSLHIEWTTLAQTAQLLVFHKGTETYEGGAHGYVDAGVLYWDKVGRRRLSFADLVTDKAGALATVRAAFCKKLVAERKARLAGYDDPSVSDCAAFSDEMSYAFTRIVGGKFGRLTVYCPAYTAGSYAEGAYEIELYIPKEMISFIKPAWRASFPG